MADRNSERLSEGDSVYIERESGEGMKGVVVSAELDGVDVVVDGPIVEGELLAVSRTVRDDARYTAAMQVVDAGPGRSRVRLVGDWKRLQMRDHVRVAVLGMRIDVIGGEGIENRDETAKLLDLSAGGLRFESCQRYAMASEVELSFSLPEVGPVHVRGEVVRMAESSGGSARPCQYGIRFNELPEATRVKVMTWVFAEQARRFREKKREEAGDG